MKIDSIVDFFIHSSRFENPELLSRTRLFVRASLLTSLFSNSFIWLSLVFEFEKGVYLMAFNVIGFLLLTLLVKTKISITWLGNVYILFGTVAVVVLSYYSGGIYSAIYPWIASIPILALLVVNRISGFLWGAISLFLMIWIGSYALQGIDLPVEVGSEFKTVWQIQVSISLLLIILLIAYVFEKNQSDSLDELKNKNKLLKEQKDTIKAQSNNLKKHIEYKDYIIRIMAHDLKNPLFNISSLVKLIEINPNEDSKSKYLEMITQSSSKATELIDRVLEMEISNSNKLEIKIEDIDLNLAVVEAIEIMKTSAIKKNITLNYQPSNEKRTIQADKIYLHYIIENLVSNALKFSEKNTQVRVITESDSSHARIKVIDQGPGINPKEKHKLFRKFSKLSSTPTDGENSTGLGLSIVKKYAESMNGKVWHEDAPEVGAIFIIELPFKNN